MNERVFRTNPELGPRKINTYSFVNQLNYVLNNKRTIDPYSLTINLQHTARMAKVSATLNYKLLVAKQFIDIRLFAGTFLAGNKNERGYYAFRSSGYTGSNDYAFESNHIGRNETNGLPPSQFIEKDGALKVYTFLGSSSQWMAGINLKSPRLFKTPVKLFADIVTCDGRYLDKDIFLWDAGINITIFKNILEVYIPFGYSNDIKNLLDRDKIEFINRIRFTLSLNKIPTKNFAKELLSN